MFGNINNRAQLEDAVITIRTESTFNNVNRLDSDVYFVLSKRLTLPVHVEIKGDFISIKPTPYRDEERNETGLFHFEYEMMTNSQIFNICKKDLKTFIALLKGKTEENKGLLANMPVEKVLQLFNQKKNLLEQGQQEEAIGKIFEKDETVNSYINKKLFESLFNQD